MRRGGSCAARPLSSIVAIYWREHGEHVVPEYDLEDSVGYWIACTAHSFRRALEDVLVEEKITFRQWEVLAWLAENGAQSQVQLAERVGIETQTLVGVLQRMERDGWLERQNCSEDRRRKRIRGHRKGGRCLEPYG